MSRLTNAWRAMTHEQRLAAIASFGLFLSMFLHWYSKTVTIVVHGAAKASGTSLSAFQAFSFVEAAVLLVSAGVLAMLFARAEGRTFHLPGGDGATMMLAGGWSALLIFYRLIDKPGLQGNERVTATVGVEWGIFIALLLALGLLYTGLRMRAGERSAPPRMRSRRDPRPQREPLEPPETPMLASGPPLHLRSTPVPATRKSPVARSPYPPAPRSGTPEQLSFEDPPPKRGD